MPTNFITQGKNIDLVLCVDGTGSMTPVGTEIKRLIRKLPSDIALRFADEGIDVDSMRVKIIVFRDYREDDSPMEQSPFFEIPEDNIDFAEFVDGITFEGGGDEKENGLEALYLAMKSDFRTGSIDNKQCIVLISDGDVIMPGESYCSGLPGYPVDMPEDIKGLAKLWESVGRGGGRSGGKSLIMYAPDFSRYHDVARELEGTEFLPVDLGRGETEKIDPRQIALIILQARYR